MPAIWLVLAAIGAASSQAATAPTTPSVQTALADTAGNWRGELQYRDYQANTAQGLPMTVAVVAQPASVTTERTALYDDGPKAGVVTITTVEMIAPAAGTASYAVLHEAREIDVGTMRIAEFRPGADGRHWTIVTVERRKDGDQIADVRETTTRDGAQMTTLKEVNPVNDGRDDWLPRNRTVLKAVSVG